jgi:hypothetical protein
MATRRRNPARVTRVHVTPAKALDLLVMYNTSGGRDASIWLPRDSSAAARQKWIDTFGKGWANAINAFANYGDTMMARDMRGRYFATKEQMIMYGMSPQEASLRAGTTFTFKDFPIGVFSMEADHIDKIAKTIATALKKV